MNKSTPPTDEQRILLLAPTGKDAQLSRAILADSGFSAHICSSVEEICDELNHGAGTVILAEEALSVEHLQQLAAPLARQQAWSDLPIVLLTHGGPNSTIAACALETLGNVLLLDRPVHIATLLSTLRMAIRARTRQYQIREHMREREQAAEERAKLYAAEQQARMEAEAALRVRDEFLSIAAHELKTPLTSLLGNVELIERRARREGSLSERDARAIHVATQQGRRLRQMIDGLLDLSRLERGQLNIEPALLDLRALARRVVEEAQPGLSNHRMTCKASDTPVVVMGDELRLEQVLQNLLQNAVRYSPGGGIIEVMVEADIRSQRALLQVRDQGIGMPAEALSQLFQRFYRAPNQIAEHIHGIGIGLYVVKEIVSLHSGTVAVTSEEGVGSIFSVSLPLLKDLDPPSHAPQEQVENNLHNNELPDLPALKTVALGESAE
jgi:signal transduction histidine kinase